MSNNPFDTALNGYVYDEHGNQLDGIGSSIKKHLKKKVNKVKKTFKKVKKIASKVNKVRKKIDDTVRRKLLPDKVEKAIRKIEKSPVAKAIAIGVASFFAGPLVLTAIGSFSPAAAAALSASGMVSSGGSFATHMTKVVAQEALKKGVSNVVKARLKDKAQKIQATMDKEQQKQINAEIDAELRTIIDDPAFVITAREMIKEGKSIEEILQLWVNSDTYSNTAVNAASNAVYPAAYDELVSAGASHTMADTVATDLSLRIGADAVEQVKADTNGNLGKVALIAIPLLMAAMGG